jgi:hypothetical protein
VTVEGSRGEERGVVEGVDGRFISQYGKKCMDVEMDGLHLAPTFHVMRSASSNLIFEIIYNNTELTADDSGRSLYLRSRGLTIRIYAVRH